MSYELITALTLFAFVSSITPGPNNLMLMASGANFGFRRSVPHMFGVTLGFILMIILVGVGLVQVFEAYPLSNTVLKVVSIAYLLYLATKIATAAPLEKGETAGTPMTLLQAALFQWVNPKAWTMAVTAVTVYTPDHTLTSIAVVALVFGTLNLPSIGSWTFLGQQMARILTNPRRMVLFNWTMALLLVTSLYPVLFP